MCFSSWQQHLLWVAASLATCACARERIAAWHARRHGFRIVVSCLRSLAERCNTEAVAARLAVKQGKARRIMGVWCEAVSQSIFRKHCAALKMYTEHLSCRVLRWWRAAAEQSKLDSDVEEQKRLLTKKVLGWLREMDDGGLRGLDSGAAD